MPSSIKAILFDKDGTLLDFNRTWRPLLEHINEDVLAQLCTPEEIRHFNDILGIQEDGFHEDSVFLKDGLEAIVSTFLQKADLDKSRKQLILSAIKEDMNQGGLGYIKPVAFTGLKNLMTNLKEKELILGVVSSDLQVLTEKQLQEVGIREYFDFVGADDGKRKLKPDPEILQEFCKDFHVESHEVAMVGDTIVDMLFAKNNHMGRGVYVNSSYPNGEAKELADIVLDNIIELDEII